MLHGDWREDEYAWLRDPSDPWRARYLETEREIEQLELGRYHGIASDYSAFVRRHIADVVPREFSLRGTRFRWQGSRLERRGNSTRGGWRAVFDTEVYGARAGGGGVTSVAISPDGRFIALMLHRTGDEQWMLRIRSVDRGRDLGIAYDHLGPSVAWLGPDRVLVTRVDERGRPASAHVCDLTAGSGVGAAILVAHEPTAWLEVHALADGMHAIVSGAGHWIASAGQPHALARLDLPADLHLRSAEVGARDDILLVHAADDQGGDVLLAAAMQNDHMMASHVLFRAEESETIEGSSLHDDCIVFLLRRAGVPHVRVIERDGTLRYDIPLVDLGVADSVDIYDTEIPPTPTSTCVMTSRPIDPGEEFTVDVDSGTLHALRRLPVPPHWPHDDLVARVEWVRAHDGTDVPMTIVHRRDIARPAPTILHGYGAYGISSRMAPNADALFWLSRGWVLAFAHVRGGGELGPRWHRAATGAHKYRSVSDFVACARALVANGLSEPARLAADGGSAGGLLVCAVAITAPDAFGAVVARHPVTDVIEFLSDPSGRLAGTSQKEFGNIFAREDVYRAVKSYNPFDNITTAPYPAFLFVTGLQDERVPWWHAARLALRLRMYSTSGLPIVMLVGSIAGHTGGWKSGERDPSGSAAAFLVARFERP